MPSSTRSWAEQLLMSCLNTTLLALLLLLLEPRALLLDSSDSRTQLP